MDYLTSDDPFDDDYGSPFYFVNPNLSEYESNLLDSFNLHIARIIFCKH